MEINTNYCIGDKIWKVENSKAVCFEVRYIAYDGSVYYGTCAFDLCIESQCFASKDELLKYVGG